MAAANRTPTPIKNVAFRLSFCIRSSATGNPITGGLTGLAGLISKDDAAFASTTNAPVEIGTTGFGYLDLTATEMNCYGGDVSVSATNANAIVFAKEFACLATVAPSVGNVPSDPYTMLYWIMARCYNKNVNTGVAVTVYDNDGVTPLATGIVTNTDTTSIQSSIRP